MTPSTSAAAAAVSRALALAAESLGDPRVTAKGPRDLVTATDVAVEDLLRSAAASLGISVVGEERGGEAPAGEPYWLVDPLCGTANFAAGIPLYSVNLAVVLDGAVVAAVVGDGSTGDVLVAERGSGAWRSGARLASSASGAVVVEAGRSSSSVLSAAAAFTAAALRAERWDVMALNSTVSLAYVATGRVAAYVLFPKATLHVAAGALLCAEAGAVVTDLRGVAWTLDSDSLVAAATPELHRDLLALLP